jgi:spore maturation protein CgeB
MTKDEREELGRKGSEHVNKNYNFEKLTQKWVTIMDQICEKYGSWEDRKLYSSWSQTEIL